MFYIPVTDLYNILNGIINSFFFNITVLYLNSFLLYTRGRNIYFFPKINMTKYFSKHNSTIKIINIILVMHLIYTCNYPCTNISVISWRSILLVEETRVPGENHWLATSHWQTLSHNAVSSTPHLSGIQTHNISGDRYRLHR